MSSATSRHLHKPNAGGYTAGSYRRRDEHRARTSKGEEEQSYVLALLTDSSHHRVMTALREQHFPPKLNKLDAHIALFRVLPGSQLERIKKDIGEITSSTTQLSLQTSTPFRMKQGVGILVVHDEGVKSVFEQLQGRWGSFLSRQDSGRFQAHYTIQNKVEDEQVVEQTLQDVTDQFRGSRGVVEGLRLYRYDKGYWRQEADFMFRAEEDTKEHKRL